MLESASTVCQVLSSTATTATSWVLVRLPSKKIAWNEVAHARRMVEFVSRLWP